MMARWPPAAYDLDGDVYNRRFRASSRLVGMYRPTPTPVRVSTTAFINGAASQIRTDLSAIPQQGNHLYTMAALGWIVAFRTTPQHVWVEVCIPSLVGSGPPCLVGNLGFEPRKSPASKAGGDGLTPLIPDVFGATCQIRTDDTEDFNLLLYQAELKRHMGGFRTLPVLLGLPDTHCLSRIHDLDAGARNRTCLVLLMRQRCSPEQPTPHEWYRSTESNCVGEAYETFRVTARRPAYIGGTGGNRTPKPVKATSLQPADFTTLTIWPIIGTPTRNRTST
jgi:hypothetical protein